MTFRRIDAIAQHLTSDTPRVGRRSRGGVGTYPFLAAFVSATVRGRQPATQTISPTLDWYKSQYLMGQLVGVGPSEEVRVVES
jgi:hypothetical protein